MRKMKIVVVDSGINIDTEAGKCVKFAYTIKRNPNTMEWEAVLEDSIDTFGHGTAVSNIIYGVNSNVEFISVKIGDGEIDEKGLVYALTYIFENIQTDLINISAGITYIYDCKELSNICQKLHNKGVIVVSAFDNDGAISFPAAFDTVVGVDVYNEFKDKEKIIFQKNSIVNLLVPNIHYRTIWINKKTIIKGTSFACAYITGLISLKCDSVEKYNYQHLFDVISSDTRILPRVTKVTTFEYSPKKVIIFPLNKESSSLLRFSDELTYKIIDVFDERFSGKVGQKHFGYKVKSFDDIDWKKDFDTIILSCTDHLTHMSGRDYKKEIFLKAKQYNKHIYTFEKINEDYKNLFYPEISSDNVPHFNCSKLYKTTIPILSVLGTSSKQGKFTLQRNLISRFNKLGYNTGAISTEPSGYLFNSDYVFHFGYNSGMDMYPWEIISILNSMVFNVQNKGKDILISGCQSSTIHYDNSQLDSFSIMQYSFLLGLQADCVILSVNPHDEINYIKRTIQFIESLDCGSILALVVFPVIASQSLTGVGYKSRALSKEEMQKIKKKYTNEFSLPVFDLGNNDDMDALTGKIIDYYSE